jgi:hypothetical protein
MAWSTAQHRAPDESKQKYRMHNNTYDNIFLKDKGGGALTATSSGVMNLEHHALASAEWTRRQHSTQHT